MLSTTPDEKQQALSRIARGVRGEALPEPFNCVICLRDVKPDPWHWHRDHRPPICRYCSNNYGHQVRIHGMTRGDHHTLQRLSAVTDALVSASYMEAYRGRFTAV